MQQREKKTSKKNIGEKTNKIDFSTKVYKKSVFFYHSNISKEIIGLVEIIKTSFLDGTNKERKFVAFKVMFRN